MRVLFNVFLILFIGFGSIVYLFYREDVKNNLPTPVPEFIEYVPYGKRFEVFQTPKKLVLFHFFNPNCPCSRFNLEEVKRIHKMYGNDVAIQFVATAPFNKNFIPFDAAFVLDTNGTIAKKYGVYSTPQAVLLSKDGVLLYRGNYNKARYCSSLKTAFVEQAILSYLNDESPEKWMQVAGLPYGCAIFKE